MTWFYNLQFIHNTCINDTIIYIYNHSSIKVVFWNNILKIILIHDILTVVILRAPTSVNIMTSNRVLITYTISHHNVFVGYGYSSKWYFQSSDCFLQIHFHRNNYITPDPEDQIILTNNCLSKLHWTMLVHQFCNTFSCTLKMYPNVKIC